MRFFIRKMISKKVILLYKHIYKIYLFNMENYSSAIKQLYNLLYHIERTSIIDCNASKLPLSLIL